MSAQEVARALLAATQELGRAMETGDWTGLEQALERRRERFAALHELTEDAAELGLRPVLERVRALDREIENAAQRTLGTLREQLADVAASRRAARGYRRPAEPPLFIARRV